MAVETVDILVQDDEVVPSPVDGISVRVYDATGATLLASAVTGLVTPGHVEFSLDGDDPPIEYQLRFWVPAGGSVISPQQIEVWSPPANSPTGTNNFEISVHLFSLPDAVDPRLCRCSGYMYGPNGKPRPGIDMHFIPCFNPVVVDGIGVLGERVATRTDADGYVQVDLYRGGGYQATVESHENVQREVLVPDRPSVNINHLLFPRVASIEFDPVGPWTVATGEELEVTPTILATDFREAEAADVVYETEDTDVATVTPGADGQIFIRGIGPGTTNLKVTRRDDSIVYIPDPGISGATVPITVT